MLSYFIFNYFDVNFIFTFLRIILLQFGVMWHRSVLEPSQNFLSSERKILSPSSAHHAEDERSISAWVTGCNFLNKLLTSTTVIIVGFVDIRLFRY
ncbi:hypothetical protein V1477_020713 [Vespula maculifrons]|uniref:Uncharacterized protein n=1 Tax=Vespula maculifrons TaxID=7453 RepID=A0ABD2AMN5_VESMC